jgi:formylglycine-generating enzyme required for sulfatase activity
MKICFIACCLLIFKTQHVLGNNVQVSNVQLAGQDTVNNFTMVEFDISWENSWRYTGGPANWDAAWIFIKYRTGNAGDWKHAWLNNTGHQSCINTTIENGLQTPGTAFNPSTNPVMGVFVYRSVAGSGNFSCQNIQLRWNYGANGVADNAQIDIKVFAIEHVYIPSGSFVVGSGGNDHGEFYTYPDITSSFIISSEAAITVGTQPGNLYYSNDLGYTGDQTGPIPATYPKGFKAFYAMKYEISQVGYVDFLNTLNRNQQSFRARGSLNGPTHYRFVLTNSNQPVNRSGVACRALIPPVPGEVEFFCDLNNNSIPNESNDGQNIACTQLWYADVAAYLDWASLRLMTEFEFEKCGRGPLPPVSDEFAWGNNVFNPITGIQNAGTAAEIPVDYISNVAANASNTLGPLRTGAFARATSNRSESGAGYYGALDLSGNLRERGVNISTPFSRVYNGVHGDGILGFDGQHIVDNWPSAENPVAAFFRGGCLDCNIDQNHISNRRDATGQLPYDSFNAGGRGVRTVEQ